MSGRVTGVPKHPHKPLNQPPTLQPRATIGC